MAPTISAKVITHRSRTKFGKSYTEYVIEVIAAGLEWKVYKRFSQFSELHAQLQAAHPKSILPPLPPASMFGTLKLGFILARQHDLAKYMDALMAVQDIAESSPLLIFLGALGRRPDQADGVPEVKRLHVDRLMEIVKEGDIILMKTSGLLQGITRVFTQGPYDHCGCVVPAPNESGPGTEWALLEATIEGVHYYGLRRRLLSWDLSNAKVVIRRLTIERSEQTKNILRDFCVEVDGKPYSLNPMKMLRKTSVADKPSYFCSELVASAYKRLQLLPESVSTGEYLPTTFAQATNLQLLRGKLEDEILVEFRKNEVAESRTASTSSNGLTPEQHKQLAKWMHPFERSSVPTVLSIPEEKAPRSPSPAHELPHVPRRRASSIPSPVNFPRRALPTDYSSDTLLAVLKSMDDLDQSMEDLSGRPRTSGPLYVDSARTSHSSHSSVEEGCELNPAAAVVDAVGEAGGGGERPPLEEQAAGEGVTTTKKEAEEEEIATKTNEEAETTTAKTIEPAAATSADDGGAVAVEGATSSEDSAKREH